MKLINRVINKIVELWIKFKLLFVSKEKKDFAKKALDARTIHKHNFKIQKSYFDRLPRRNGFKKAPTALKVQIDNAPYVKPNPPQKKKPISQKLRDARELAQAKRSFFIELISARAKEIQRPFIKEKRKKKAARKSTNKTLQIV